MLSVDLYSIVSWLFLSGHLFFLTVLRMNSPAPPPIMSRLCSLFILPVSMYGIYKVGVLGRLRRVWTQAGRQKEQGEEGWIGWGTAAGDILVVASTVALGKAVVWGR